MADFRLSPRISLGGGVSYVRADGADEWRPHQQVSLTFGSLGLRSTIEERLINGAPRAELRLRERARLTEALDRATRLNESIEFLYILQPRDHASSARVDSSRFYLSATHKLSAHFDGSAGYQLVLSPRAAAPDRVSHIPTFSITWHA